MMITAQEISEATGFPTYEQLKEWCEANVEGRLLILPCKAGDTVYLIEQIMMGVKRIFDARINSISVNYTGDINLHFDGHPPVYNVSSIGKTVFLTREEAEAALRGDTN